MKPETREALGFLQQYLDATADKRSAEIRQYESFGQVPETHIVHDLEVVSGWAEALRDARQLLQVQAE